MSQDAHAALVIHKRRGTQDPGDQYVTMTVRVTEGRHRTKRMTTSNPNTTRKEKACPLGNV